MTRIGVRALKAHLSEHLHRAQAGERFLVTDRGTVIAALGPAETPKRVEWAVKMVAEGKARWNGGKPIGLRPRIPNRGGKLASEMIIEDRR
jgi:antitoxin (DNA-binding transcriptional repressor) of toxin-antitoxin stability system